MLEHDLKIVDGLIKKKLFDEALEYLKDKEKNYQNDYQFYLIKGTLEFSEKLIDLSIHSLQKATTLNSTSIKANFQLAQCFKAKGDFVSSKDYLKKTINLDPKNELAYFFLSSLFDKEKDEDLFLSLQELLIGKPNSSYLNFAIATIYEKKGNYELAFSHYQKANLSLDQFYNYSLEEEQNNYNILKKVFNSNKKLNFSNNNHNLKRIVFICGMPRSGTTLIEQIISSHSKVASGGELSIIPRAFAKFINYEFNYENIISKVNSLSSEMYYAVREAVFNEYNKVSDQLIITDKLPNNFRNIGFIKLFFPEAKIIFCNRDPRDNVISIFKNFFDINMKTLNYVNKLGNIKNEILLHNDLIKYWTNIYDFYNLNYEYLIQYHDDEIKKILNYCELDFEKECLEYYKNKNNVFTLSAHQVRKPIYKDSIEGWKKYQNFLSEEIVNLRGLHLKN